MPTAWGVGVTRHPYSRRSSAAANSDHRRGTLLREKRNPSQKASGPDTFRELPVAGIPVRPPHGSPEVSPTAVTPRLALPGCIRPCRANDARRHRWNRASDSLRQLQGRQRVLQMPDLDHQPRTKAATAPSHLEQAS